MRTYLVVDNNELYKMLVEGNFTECFMFTAQCSHRTTSLGSGLC